MRGRKFTPSTIELIKLKASGKQPSAETRRRMSASSGGVRVYVFNLQLVKCNEYPTKSAAAKALGCSIRTVDRRCKDGKPYSTEGGPYILSFEPNLK